MSKSSSDDSFDVHEARAHHQLPKQLVLVLGPLAPALPTDGTNNNDATTTATIFVASARRGTSGKVAWCRDSTATGIVGTTTTHPVWASSQRTVCEYPDEGSDDDECDTIFVEAFAVPVTVFAEAPPSDPFRAGGAWRALGKCSLDCVIQACSGPEQKRTTTLRASDADRRITFSLFPLVVALAAAPPSAAAVSTTTAAAVAVAPSDVPALAKSPVGTPSPPAATAAPHTPAAGGIEEAAVAAPQEEASAAIVVEPTTAPKPVTARATADQAPKPIEPAVAPPPSPSVPPPVVPLTLVPLQTPPAPPVSAAVAPPAPASLLPLPTVAAEILREAPVRGVLTFCVRRAVGVPRVGSASIKAYVAVERRVTNDEPAKDVLHQTDVASGDTAMTFFDPKTKKPPRTSARWCRIDGVTIGPDSTIDALLHFELREKRLLKDPALARATARLRVPRTDSFRTDPWAGALSWQQRVQLSGETSVDVMVTFISDDYHTTIVAPLVAAWAKRPVEDTTRYTVTVIGVAVTILAAVMGAAKRRSDAEYDVTVASLRALPRSVAAPAMAIHGEGDGGGPTAAATPPTPLFSSGALALHRMPHDGGVTRQCYLTGASVSVRPDAIKLLPIAVALTFSVRGDVGPSTAAEAVTTVDLPAVDNGSTTIVDVPLSVVAPLGDGCTATLVLRVSKSILHDDTTAIATAVAVETTVAVPTCTALESGGASVLGMVLTTAVEPVAAAFPDSMRSTIERITVVVSTQTPASQQQQPTASPQPRHRSFEMAPDAEHPTSDVTLVSGEMLRGSTSTRALLASATVSVALRGGLIAESTGTFIVPAPTASTLQFTGHAVAATKCRWAVRFGGGSSSGDEKKYRDVEVARIAAQTLPLHAFAQRFAEAAHDPTDLAAHVAALVAPSSIGLHVNVLQGVLGSVLVTVSDFNVSPGCAASGLVTVQAAGNKALAVAFDPVSRNTAGRVLVLPTTDAALEVSLDDGAVTQSFQPWPPCVNAAAMESLPPQYTVMTYVPNWGVVSFQLSRAVSGDAAAAVAAPRAEYCPVLPHEASLVLRVLPTSLGKDQTAVCDVGFVVPAPGAATALLPSGMPLELTADEPLVVVCLVPSWRSAVTVKVTPAAAATGDAKATTVECTAAANAEGSGSTAIPPYATLQWRHGRAHKTSAEIDDIVTLEKRQLRVKAVAHSARALPPVRCDFAVQTTGPRDFEPPVVISPASAVVLNDLVVVVGGRLADGALCRHASVYRPKTRQWQSVECPVGSADRYSHVAVAFEGHVVLHGGVGVGGFAAHGQRVGIRSDVWRFDVLAAVWEPMETVSAEHPALAAPPELHRARHSAVVYGRSMLVYGGESPTVRELAAPSKVNKKALLVDGDGIVSYVLDTQVCDGFVLALDLVTFRWTVHSPQPAPAKFRRSGHAAVLVGPDTMLVFGGADGEGNPTNSLLSYNVVLRKWQFEETFGDAQPPPMVGHSAVALNVAGRECMVVIAPCRCVAYLYDLDTCFWKVIDMGPRSAVRRQFGTVAAWHRSNVNLHRAEGTADYNAPFASLLCFGGQDMDGRPARNVVALLITDDAHRTAALSAASVVSGAASILRRSVRPRDGDGPTALERPAPSAAVAVAALLPVDRIEKAVQRLSRPRSAARELDPIDRANRKLEADEQDRINNRLSAHRRRPTSAPQKNAMKLSREDADASSQRLTVKPPRPELKPIWRPDRVMTPQEAQASGSRLTSTRRKLAIAAAERALAVSAAAQPAKRTDTEWTETMDRLHPDPPTTLSSGLKPRR